MYEELKNNIDNLILVQWCTSKRRMACYVYLFVYKSISNIIPENLMCFLLMFHFVNCFENSTAWQILRDVFNPISIKTLKLFSMLKWYFGFQENFWSIAGKLQAVLIKKNAVKCRISKFNLFKQLVRYLGLIVSTEGYVVDPNDDAVLETIGKTSETNCFWHFLDSIKVIRKSF